MLLQGGGALGAYQAGVYEALTEAGIHPNWAAGISIGAINAALIAGTPPEKRAERLRQFWEQITDDNPGGWLQDFLSPLGQGDWSRTLTSRISAGMAMMHGVPAFFAPRLPLPWMQQAGAIEATSLCDTAKLKSTLENLVDFDRVNSEEARFSVGAVNVRNGTALA